MFQRDGVMAIAVKKIAAVYISDGKGITIETVSHLEVTLVVCTPDVIRFLCYGRGTSGMHSSGSSFCAGYQTFPFEDICCSGDCGKIRIP
jgi:hypothetical protein